MVLLELKEPKSSQSMALMVHFNLNLASLTQIFKVMISKSMMMVTLSSQDLSISRVSHLTKVSNRSMVHQKNTIQATLFNGLKLMVTTQEVLISSLESQKETTPLFSQNALVWPKLWMVDTLCHADRVSNTVAEPVSGEIRQKQNAIMTLELSGDNLLSKPMRMEMKYGTDRTAITVPLMMQYRQELAQYLTQLVNISFWHRMVLQSP